MFNNQVTSYNQVTNKNSSKNKQIVNLFKIILPCRKGRSSDGAAHGQVSVPATARTWSLVRFTQIRSVQHDALSNMYKRSVL